MASTERNNECFGSISHDLIAIALVPKFLLSVSWFLYMYLTYTNGRCAFDMLHVLHMTVVSATP